MKPNHSKKPSHDAFEVKKRGLAQSVTPVKCKVLYIK